MPCAVRRRRAPSAAAPRRGAGRAGSRRRRPRGRPAAWCAPPTGAARRTCRGGRVTSCLAVAAAEADEQRAGRVGSGHEQPVDVPRAAAVGACGRGRPSSVREVLVDVVEGHPPTVDRGPPAERPGGTWSTAGRRRRLSAALPTVDGNAHRRQEEDAVTEQRTYPEGVTSWVDTEQDDVDAAADFYSGALRLDLHRGDPAGGAVPLSHRPARRPGRRWARRPGDARRPRAVALARGAARWHTYVAVDDADAAAAPRRAGRGSRRPAADGGRGGWPVGRRARPAGTRGAPLGGQATSRARR